MSGTPPPARADVEQRVLGIVHGLVTELGGLGRDTPALDDSLEADLGISSLERVELLLRLERAFGARLPDSVMAEAETPEALVTAILTAAPPLTEAVPGRVESSSPDVSAPVSARTLVDVLRWHAERAPDRTHIYLRQEDGTEATITYGQLLRASIAVAAGLKESGVAPAEPVVLMLRSEAAFFSAFMGTLLAGGIPVPIYPPLRVDRLADYARRQQAIVNNAGARVLMTFAQVERLATLIRTYVPAFETITTVDRLSDRQAEAHYRMAAANDPALIQYTSGSTGNPKGVVLSHSNLLANIRAIGDGLAVRPGDVCASWLPLYHDMGLIGAWLASMYFGVPVSIMSPLAFLARPARWLWAIHSHGATVSPAPNFAFDLVARKVTDNEIEGLDLSTWRLALNGSEAVSPDTIERFTRRFEPYGFRPQAMRPVYGLAEASVGLTISLPGELPRVDRIAREPFERAREVQRASADESRPLRFVSSGRPLSGHEVRIVDVFGELLGDRREGRIQFRGPSVTRGYYKNTEATAAVLRDGWMDSGDLGYWADGNLFVTGRDKDTIIQGGRNVSAHEVEDAVAAVEGIRKGSVAAFGVHDPSLGTERLVVVAESREQVPANRERLRKAVLEQVAVALGVPPDVVVIARPGAVLKTSSGKIRRHATRDAYVTGTLGRRRSNFGQWASLSASAGINRARDLGKRLGQVAFTLRILTAVGLTVPFLWCYVLLEPAGPRTGRAAQRWSRMMMTLCGVPLKVMGTQHLRGMKSGLLAANHASYIDSIVLMASIPFDFRFVAKRRLADYPVIGAVIRKAGHLTIEKMDLSQRLAGADDVVQRLIKDDVLAVFPEGTFRRQAGLLPFRLGAFRAAVESGRPIVPVAIRGTRGILPDGTWLFRRGAIEVTVSEPLTPEGSGWPEMVRLRDKTRTIISRGSGEPFA
jgi:1-acyl-sn-glycerol-3-phosphate acyltransferase